ncbi:helix-turn-helix domain-containing protein [Streptomyces sp. NPDC046862]|uniref:TetR/AcrR family transcriptional regulator n=1 Tax=Streptomyces sp. NPDC046862 TaxID=3154603 RepID=UPI0034562757
MATGSRPDYEIRRQKVIDTAARLFARKGYAATSVNDPSQAAGLAKGALYYSVGFKENLLIEIQGRSCHRSSPGPSRSPWPQNASPASSRPESARSRWKNRYMLRGAACP